MSDAVIPPVTHNTAATQFEIDTGSGLALLKYVPVDGALDLVHTEVPAAVEGRGYGTALAEAAFAHAREAGLRVIPTCPFVRHYVEEHPEQAVIVKRRAGS